MSNNYKLTIGVSVEFEDVDSYQIAHHTKLIAYCERARVRYFANNGFNCTNQSIGVVLYSLSIKFRKPALLFDILDVSIQKKNTETFRIGFDYRISRKNDCILKAFGDVAFINIATKEIVAVPQEFCV